MTLYGPWLGNICFMQPKTLAARTNVATRFVADMGLDPSTVVVDGRDANSGGPGGPPGPLGLTIV